jgi:hypothetical protein
VLENNKEGYQLSFTVFASEFQANNPSSTLSEREIEDVFKQLMGYRCCVSNNNIKCPLVIE